MAKEADFSCELDLTPMIDMVFQLVMFFIIVTDFSKRDIALLELPFSVVGETDEGEDPRRVIINITSPSPSQDMLDRDSNLRARWPANKLKQADKIIIREKDMTFDQVREYLYNRGAKFEKYREKENPTLSSTSVLIRCDGKQAFDYVRAILQICARPEVAIYKIELATAEEPPKK